MTVSAKTIVQSADIPPIPGLLQQILSLADDPRTTSSQLEKLVSQEPSLAAKLLKWVNSAQYALAKRVNSVGHAMVLLGFSTVKSVASGMILINAFDDLHGVSKQVVRGIWEHTLLAANFTKILTRREPISKQDDLFLAAMIHDVGHLVMYQYFSKKYEALAKTVFFPLAEEEIQVFGVDHAQISAELLEQWRFPEDVIYLVKSHHKPRSFPGPAKDISYLIVCDKLSEQTDLTNFLKKKEAEIEPSLLDALKNITLSWKDLQDKAELFEATKQTVLKLFEGVSR